MLLTRQELQAIFWEAPDDAIEVFLQQQETILASCELMAVGARLTIFLAQIGHESKGLQRLEEPLSFTDSDALRRAWPSRFSTEDSARPFLQAPERLANHIHANRLGNGPVENGDGWRYRGRGYLRITGRDAYRQLGALTGLDLVNQPDLVLAPEYNLSVACAFWKWKFVNEPCDRSDLVEATLQLCGTYSGLEERQTWLERVHQNLSLPLPTVGRLDRADRATVQGALIQAGFLELGAEDGVLGPDTRKAIRHFRKNRGLPDLLVDANLCFALRQSTGQLVHSDTQSIQQALHKADYGEVGVADGVIGPKTTGALLRYRKEKQIPPVLVDHALIRELGLSRRLADRILER